MRRVVVGALFVEILPIAVLSVLTAWAGPREREDAIAFAASASRWVGLVGGIVAGFLVGWLVARRVSRDHFWYGFLVGLFAAVLEVAIFLLAGTPIDAWFVASTVGRMGAAIAGASLAGRQVTRGA